MEGVGKGRRGELRSFVMRCTSFALYFFPLLLGFVPFGSITVSALIIIIVNHVFLHITLEPLEIYTTYEASYCYNNNIIV